MTRTQPTIPALRFATTISSTDHLPLECPRKPWPEWAIDDWWPEPVKQVFRDATAEATKLGLGEEDLFFYGPGHLVWADHNFDNRCILASITSGLDRRDEFVGRFGAQAVAIVMQSLQEMLRITEATRNVCDPNCDGDDDSGLGDDEKWYDEDANEDDGKTVLLTVEQIESLSPEELEKICNSRGGVSIDHGGY